MRLRSTFLAVITLFMVAPLLHAQTDCAGGRYINDLFSGHDLTSDITYGSNINLQGQTQSLEMDIYEPTGDTEMLRPLMIWSHGGSFVSGDKTQGDVTSLVEPLVKKGYVCASMEYRLGVEGVPFPGPDSVTATEAVWRAVHDAKAAVRWFYKDVKDGSNTYRIDTNRIYIAGVSAGAFISLHYGYLDKWSEVPTYVDTTGAGLGGGLEGNSGNPGYSSRVQGVINVAGALGDASWIEAGDMPLVSLHGDADQTVPYGHAMLTMLGFFPIMEVDGSQAVNDRATSLGLETCFYTYAGADHVPHVGNQAYTDTTVNFITNFMIGQVCPSQSGTCSALSVAVDDEAFAERVEVYPVPASDLLNVRLLGNDQSVVVELQDAMGRLIFSDSFAGEYYVLDRQGLGAGVYLLNLRAGERSTVKKIIFD